MMVHVRHLRAAASLAAAALLAVACSGGSSGDKSITPPGNNPYITLNSSASTLSVTQGATANVTVTVTRYGGYTGDVAITVEGLPSGVTASALTIAAEATQGTVTLTAAPTATVAGATLTIRGSGSGIAAVTSTVALNVTAAAATGAVSVTFSPASLTIVQGATVNVTATITRTGGFTGPVTLNVTGAPALLTVTITPTASASQSVAVSSNSATISFAAASNLPAGVYPITISASGQNVTTQTVMFTTTVNVATAGTGNTTLGFCAALNPVYVAVQDGGGPWTQVTAGANNTYTFSITSGKGAIAYATQPVAGSSDLNVIYLSQGEFTALGTQLCPFAGPTGKTLTGTMAGLASTDAGVVVVGNAAGAASAANGLFTLNNVPNVNVDLFATRSAFMISGSTVTSTLMSVLIRRNTNYSAGSVIPTLDMSAGSSEAFAPIPHTLTINNLNGDMAFTSLAYFTGNGTTGPLGSDITITGSNTRMFPTIPDARRAPGDLYNLGVFARSSFGSATGTTRFSSSYFAASADKTLTLGPDLNAPVITTLSSGPPVLLRDMITVQPEYNTVFFVSYVQGSTSPKVVTVSATSSYVGSTGTVTLDIPNLSGASFPASWGLQPGVATTYTAGAAGFSGGITSPRAVDGSSFLNAFRSGTITP